MDGTILGRRPSVGEGLLGTAKKAFLFAYFQGKNLLHIKLKNSPPANSPAQGTFGKMWQKTDYLPPRFFFQKTCGKEEWEIRGCEVALGIHM